jgi:UDP:flavonoid glycosyltransferase YjiC (YdhE family)
VNMSASPIGAPQQFLFAMFQGSGNIPPILAVAHQLVTRGHRVRILAGPGIQPDRPPRPASATFLDGIRAIGATLILLHQHQDPFAGIPPARGLLGGWTPQGFRANVFLARRFLAAPVWADHVRAELTRQPADVVVADFYLLGALVAAEAARIPAAALVHHHHIRPTAGVPPFGPGWGLAQGLLGRLRDTIGHAMVERLYRRDGGQALNQARRQCGLPPLRSPLQQYDAAARVLVMTNSAFDFRPRVGDQPDIAARVVHAGAGVCLPQNASSTAIRTAIQGVITEPGFRDGAQRLAKAMAAEDGAKTAADALETLAGQTRPRETTAP